MAVQHQIKHYYQPTNNSCSQTCLAMVLSFFGFDMTPEQVIQGVPVNKNDKGEDWGTINQDLATWALKQGYSVEMHTADIQITDLGWANMSGEQMVERMKLAKDNREVPSLGKAVSALYMRSYISFVETGGVLHVQPFITSELIDQLLPVAPVLAAVSFGVLHKVGRVTNTGLRQYKPDDLTGGTGTHSVVIYGKDDSGKYLIADPWQEPGLHVIESAHLVAAIGAAQIECDNLLFQLIKK
jgi:hypothetical protein